MAFKDHFSAQAKDYARYRPTYPGALFDWLAGAAPSRALAVDVATGNGQAAVALAERFERVIATEPSASQLASAERRANVEYRNEPAERMSLGDGEADLVTVAQALHWFDLDAFFAEAGRVIRPGGVIAAWCYELFECEPAIDAAVERYYHDVVGPYWPPERRFLESGYAGLALPFPALDAPPFTMALDWDLDDLIGYLGTWSATQRYVADHGEDPLAALRAELAPAWGDPATARTMRWTLTVKACRKPAR